MRLFITSLLILAPFAASAASADKVATFLNGFCSRTLETGSLQRPRVHVTGESMTAALDVLHQGTISTLLVAQDAQAERRFVLPRFEYRQLLHVQNSVWFLQSDRLIEFDLSQGQFVGSYPSLPTPFEVRLTTRARGFAHANGIIYIAHGDLGVSLFDLQQRRAVGTMTTGMRPGSMAAAVQPHGTRLFILQGAYHPDGFNGVAIVDLATGKAHAVPYARESGVVDPYTSTMLIEDGQLLINNSGWIHQFDIKTLLSAKAPAKPKWISVNEMNQYLTVEGDLVAADREVMACSFVRIYDKNTIDWRMIRKGF